MMRTPVVVAMLAVLAAASEAGPPRDQRTVWLVGAPGDLGTIRVDLDSVSERSPGNGIRTQIDLTKDLGGGFGTGYAVHNRRRLQHGQVTRYAGALSTRLTRIRLSARWVGEELRAFSLRIRWRGEPDPLRLVGTYSLEDVTGAAVAPRE